MLTVVGIEDGVHDVTKGFVVVFVAFDVPEVAEGNADEDVVGDGGCELHLLGSCLLELHGDVGLGDGGFLIELLLEFHQSCRMGVAHPHRKPVEIIVVQHRRAGEWRQQLGVTASMDVVATGCPFGFSFVSLVLIGSDIEKTTLGRHQRILRHCPLCGYAFRCWTTHGFAPQNLRSSVSVWHDADTIYCSFTLTAFTVCREHKGGAKVRKKTPSPKTFLKKMRSVAVFMAEGGGGSRGRTAAYIQWVKTKNRSPLSNLKAQT